MMPEHGLRYVSDSDPYRPPFIRCKCLQEFHGYEAFQKHLHRKEAHDAL